MALTRPKIWDIDTNVEWFVDPITVLHQASTQANVDVGFLFNRANGLVSNVALYWNESSQSFVTAFTSSDGTTNTNIAITSYAGLTVGNLSTTGLYWTANGLPIATGINYTASNSPPSSAKLGDQWYYQATDTLYEYINDGTQNIWVDVQSSPTSAGVGNAPAGNLTVNGNLTVTANTYLGNSFVSGTETVTTLITTGNTTVKGNLFVTSNASSGTVTRVEYNIPHPFMLMGAS